jgi:glutathione S-transferase
MRARMALLVAGIPFVAHEIELRNKPSVLLQASPKGTVPVLVLTDGSVLEQSWDIAKWALTHPLATDGSAHWWRQAERTDNQQLLASNDGAFKVLLDRYKYPERLGITDLDAKQSARHEARHQAVSALLLPLEHRLTDARHLGGYTPCCTDIGIFPFVRQFAAVDPSWFQAQPLPQVQRWLGEWLGSPLFAAAMHKLNPNHPQPFPALDFTAALHV